MINAPGSGAGGGYWVGTFTAGQQSTYDGANTAAAKEAIQNTIANIGLDLRNDHPIGIQYCAGGSNTGTGSSTSCTDKDFNSYSVVNIGGTNYGYINLSTDPAGGPTATASRERTDIILYRRSNGNNYVECMSCHDPHNTNNTAGERVAFLRNSNTGSQICLACHNK
jgi:predicted CXXCH cytochrome family protein